MITCILCLIYYVSGIKKSDLSKNYLFVRGNALDNMYIKF